MNDPVAYVNGLQIHSYELVFIDFITNSQTQQGPTVKVCMMYETLKLFQEAINSVIDQHEKKLHQVMSDRAKAN